MQKNLLLILLAICAFAAPARAQLVFTPAEWDFGIIAEADGRVTHIFTGENRGDKPIVLLDVVTTCGCTVPEFSKQPILPNSKTTIRVSFDPANRPGNFTKELYIYSVERIKIATLTVRGNVTPRPKHLAELYPVDAGNGLRLSSTLCAFSYIYQDRPVSATISYANTTQRTLLLDLRPETSSGLLTLDSPCQIAPGERGEITFSYSIPAASPHYGTIRDLLGIYVDGHSNDTRILAHGIAIDKPGSTQATPKLAISANIIKFGSINHKAPIQRYALALSNTGEGKLIVRAVETGEHIRCTLKPGQEIPAGGIVKTEVTLDPAKQDYGVTTDQLTLITNDPERPMRRIRVTAIIEN